MIEPLICATLEGLVVFRKFVLNSKMRNLKSYAKLCLLTMLLPVSSCNRKTFNVVGNYESKCSLYLYPAVKLSLNQDSTFRYLFAYRDEPVLGRWQIFRDTLLLYSPTFESDIDSFKPISKYTDLEEKDAYLIRDKGLLRITTKGKMKDCYLERTSRKIATDDTCVYSFEDYTYLIGINKLLNLDDLIKVNFQKDFYLAFIRFFSDINKDRKTILRECSSVGPGTVVSFSDTVVSFNYQSLKVDSSILFNHIGDSTRVVFQASNCGIGFHADLCVLILKINNRYFIGYSADNSSLFATIRQIASEFFIFNDNRQKTAFYNLLAESEFVESKGN